MRIIARRTLHEYWRKHAHTRPSLEDWASKTESASWTSMAHLVATSAGRPSPITDSRVVFNIMHNAYRLVADIDFPRQILYIKFIGTHAEYDAIDPSIVSLPKP